MKFLKLAIIVIVASLGMGAIIESAEAARLGGGKSVGAQRSITQRQATPPQAAPATAGAAAQPQAAGANRWLGPLAGIAAGLGLAWLFSQGGMGPMMIGLLVVGAAIMLIMYMNRQRIAQAAAQAGSMRGAQRMQYAGLGNETVAAPPPSQTPANTGGAAWGGGPAHATPTIPAGFDVTGFVKQAKLNFIRMQEANDRADFESLRDMTTEKLYEQLSADIRHRTDGQSTDVVTLDAALLEVVTEADAHWASVRFSGQIRESASAAPVHFAEVWHLSKSITGDAGWQVAGIEQIS
jgi:predicted lipid-binding transport protein (Tim44 family)